LWYLTIAEDGATISSSFSESNGNSLLSGSVRYLIDLSEDSEAMSDASEEVDRVTAFFFPGLDVMPFPTIPTTDGKCAGQI